MVVDFMGYIKRTFETRMHSMEGDVCEATHELLQINITHPKGVAAMNVHSLANVEIFV